MVNINIEIPKKLHKDLKLKCLEEEIYLKDYVVKVLDASIHKCR